MKVMIVLISGPNATREIGGPREGDGMVAKKVLTTGEVAAYCGVNLKTVLRWIERGELTAYRLPGARGDHRIEAAAFLVFLKNNNLPVPAELTPAGKRVLIVDDDAQFVRSLQRTLRTKGFETEIAADGFSAGLLMRSFSPSLITLDLRMPGMSGLDVIKNIRGNPDYTHVKILVVSATHRDELDKAVREGADDALSKGFTANELIDKVETLLGPCC
jgi:excisionase family DNA binding protein